MKLNVIHLIIAALGFWFLIFLQPVAHTWLIFFIYGAVVQICIPVIERKDDEFED